jgi:type II secretory pathway pseudopilin PulG
MNPRLRPPNTGNRSRGFSYIGLLILIALMGIGLALAGTVWHTAVQREKERELLFIGDQFRAAIAGFYESSPGGVKKFPGSLEDLLEDRRYPTAKRHLRRIYRDPMTDGTEWGLIAAPDGSIMGVFSLSEKVPRKVSGFRTEYERFVEAKTYSDWKFAYSNPSTAQDSAGPGSQPPGSGGSPVEPGSGPTPTPTPPSQVPEDPEARREMCDLVQGQDESKCEEVEQEQGSAAAGRCRQSAHARYFLCLNRSGPIPTLSWE